jgi:hypothetical protein
MDLHEAWMIVSKMIVELNDRRLVNENELEAMEMVESCLDPYIKRICTMKGE